MLKVSTFFFNSLFASVRSEVQVRLVDRGEGCVFTGEDTVGRVFMGEGVLSGRPIRLLQNDVKVMSLDYNSFCYDLTKSRKLVLIVFSKNNF